MPHRTHRFATAVLAGAATGIAAGLLGVVAGGYLWSFIFLGPLISGALITWADISEGAESGAGKAVFRGTGAGLLSGVVCMAALPAYLAVWQEVSLMMVYNPAYWLSHQAEVSDEIGSRSGWCAVLGSLFAMASMTAGALAALTISLLPRTVPPARPSTRKAARQ